MLKVMEVLEQNAKALDDLVESKDEVAENQLDSNEDLEIVETTEVDIDDEKTLVHI